MKKAIIYSMCLISLQCLFVGCGNNETTTQKTNVETKQEIKKSKDDYNKELELAISNDSLSRVKESVEKGADVNYIGKYNLSVLQYACDLGRKDIISYLLEKGSDKSKIDLSTYNEVSSLYPFLKEKGFDVSKVKTYKQALKEIGDKNKSNQSNEKPKNFTVNGFELLEHTGGDYITGKIKNTNATSYGSVFININILDMNGNVISSTIDSVNNLQAGQTWSFKAPVTVKQKYKYQIMDIKAYK